MPFHGLEGFGAAAGGVAAAAAGVAWRAWAGVGAGWAGILLTLWDWRPMERPPPIGRAIASPSMAVADNASTALTRIFFMFMMFFPLTV
ncbi:hypothetical protein D9M68_994320 [compost metagenome]